MFLVKLEEAASLCDRFPCLESFRATPFWFQLPLRQWEIVQIKNANCAEVARLTLFFGVSETLISALRERLFKELRVIQKQDSLYRILACSRDPYGAAAVREAALTVVVCGLPSLGMIRD